MNGIYTEKGIALAARVAAGTKLTITKVMAGSGTTTTSALALAEEKQVLTIGTAAVSGQTTTLPVTLAEVKAGASYTLTELGVYARDPDAGEVLYQVFRLDESRAICAGGESVYRFYLRQSVGADGVTVACSPAGLLIDEDLAPTRDKVQAVRVPSRTVMVAASELAAYVAALPRLLTEHLTVNITGGTVSESLDLMSFYGSGSLWLRAVAGQTVSLTNGVRVYGCTTRIIFENLSLHGSTSSDGFVYIRESTDTWLIRCTIDGAEAPDKRFFGVMVEGLSMADIDTCDIKNVLAAVLVKYAEAIVETCTGSGNTIGIKTYHGGRCYLTGGTPTLLGGSTNENGGGPIFHDGALL